jgi:pantoate--beta-alanine ligase
MQTVTTIKNLAAVIKHWKQTGLSIALVPTMGNLHAGHLKLVTEAKAKADKVVVSIFVNPTQFGVGEDFDGYPRTHSQDAALLAMHDVDVLFLPSVIEVYPVPTKTLVSVSGLADLHCGVSRPRHFDGVATVVCKLFNIVQPDIAFFGEKDFQQLAIIRAVVRDLNIPVKIVSVATIREVDGLAMSSRNGYLTHEQRQIAPKVYQALCAARDAVWVGAHAFSHIEQQQRQLLRLAGFAVEYFSICRVNDLLPANPSDNDLVILVAAKLGKTRLIDNIQFKIKALTVDSL